MQTSQSHLRSQASPTRLVLSAHHQISLPSFSWLKIWYYPIHTSLWPRHYLLLNLCGWYCCYWKQSIFHYTSHQITTNDFALKDFGPFHFFLSVEAHTTESSLFLSQHYYITNLLKKTNMHEAKPVSSPMSSSTALSQYGSTTLSDRSTYRSIVGSLQYLSLTRPNISFAVNKVCQYMSDPNEDHWSVVKRILCYLKHTIHHSLQLHRDTNFNLQAFSRSSIESEYRAI